MTETRPRIYLPLLSTTGPAGASGSSCGKSPDYGMVDPYVISRKGPTGDVRIKPLFTIPTLAHIEITYACMEDCIM